MITRSELSDYFTLRLSPGLIPDATVNGLQFEGKNEIKTLAFAVDASLESLKAASEAGADALITHHGLIWGGLKAIAGIDKARLAALFQNDLNLYCFHLPLDIHKELGNNAVLMGLLGLTRVEEPFFTVGWYGTCDLPYSLFLQRIRTHVGDSIIDMPFGNPRVRRIAFCTGGAGTLPAFFEAVRGGADTLFTGETNSLLYHYAKEEGLNVVCAGHYATEVFGVQALKADLQRLYPDLKTVFLDLPTGW